MKVNIVWIAPKRDLILDRLARTLSERTGWPLSRHPDPNADLNYSICYIDFAERFTDWRHTPWAAYFSHYEAETPYKVYWWELARPLTKIQTVTADMYGDLVPNPVKVTVPVDPMFEIRERPANKKPVIGTSGFAIPRKRPDLLARLAHDLEGQADFVASGQDWPVRITNASFDGLVNFYNSLDLYVCTSTTEGVPMTPLEALACGIPVVIPRNVGMLDELPEMPGIYHYNAGIYNDLLETMKTASAELKTYSRESLRQAVSGYNPEAWATTHIQGFEQAMNRTTNNENYSNFTLDQHGKRGVYYVAYGEPARKCATAAIASFRKFLPDIPVALVGSEPLGCEDVFIKHDDEDIGGRAAKVLIDELAPQDWTYIAYLDADTEITAAETFLWNLVEDGWDMAICKNPGRFHTASQMRRSDNADECDYTFRQTGTDQLIQLNGGVFCYQRNPRTRLFFKSWVEEWRRYGKRDQAALLRALNKHPLKIYVLGNEWNYIVRYEDGQQGAAWLRHYPMTARRWRGVLHERSDDPKAWAAVRDFEKGLHK